MAEVTYLSNVAEYEEALAAHTNKAMIIEFTATWCKPCQRIGPIFEALA